MLKKVVSEQSTSVTVWIVYIGMRGQGLLQSFFDKLHLRLSPSWRCELGGRVWTQHCWALHLDTPSCLHLRLQLCLPNDWSCAFCHVQSTCSWDVYSAARTRARVNELWCFGKLARIFWNFGISLNLGTKFQFLGTESQILGFGDQSRFLSRR